MAEAELLSALRSRARAAHHETRCNLKRPERSTTKAINWARVSILLWRVPCCTRPIGTVEHSTARFRVLLVVYAQAMLVADALGHRNADVA